MLNFKFILGYIQFCGFLIIYGLCLYDYLHSSLTDA